MLSDQAKDIAKEALKEQTLSQLALIIRRDWKNVSPYARPYLDAMECCSTINDIFICNTAVSIVAYFLSNAAGWRGDIAVLVKAELRRRLKTFNKKGD